MWGPYSISGALRGNPLARLLGAPDEAPASPGPRPRQRAALPPPVAPQPPAMMPIAPFDPVGAPPMAPERASQHQMDSERHARWGRMAGDLANAGRVQPQYRAQDPAQQRLREQFNGRPPAIGPGGVGGGNAIERAAADTGVPRAYLSELITHESSGDDYAKAPTSSATGAAQFIDGTWLRMMRDYGPRYGLQPEGMSNADMLALRNNRGWSALMAAEYAQENATEMRRALRRPVSQGEAYLGHFLGAGDAVDLIAAAEQRLSDARRFVSPGAVQANPRIFYDGGRYQGSRYLGGGRPRTAQEVVRLQSRRFSSDELPEPPPR